MLMLSLLRFSKFKFPTVTPIFCCICKLLCVDNLFCFVAVMSVIIICRYTVMP